jgi:RNA ligase (TIGR02306 family)
MKLRGVFSQGLLMPLTILGEDMGALELERDVSHLIPVRKYVKTFDISLNMGSTKSGSDTNPFPIDIISKTDEDNAKTKVKVLKEYIGKTVYITLKMDGSSMTLIYMKDDEKLTVCSRNTVVESDNIMYKYVMETNILQFLKAYGKSVAIQGEFVGPKINGNQLCLTKFDYYVFNVKDLEDGHYYGLEELKDFCACSDIKFVPVLKVIEDFNMTVKELQAYANELTYDGYAERPHQKAEGIVFRPTVPVFSEVLGKHLSLKIINQNYKD